MRADNQVEPKANFAASLVNYIPIMKEPPSGKSVDAVLGQSTSDGPDEVFDIFERYDTEFRDQHSGRVEERDPCPEEREEAENHDVGLENYLLDLMGKLKFKDVIAGLQAYPETNSEERDEFVELNVSHVQETTGLKHSLEKETAKRQELSMKLEDIISRNQQELLEERTKASQWAAKLQIQESTYSEHLEQEREKVRTLEEKIKEMELSTQTKNNYQSNQEEELKIKLRELETKYRQQLSEEKRRRVNSEATLSFQTTKQQYQLDSLQNKLSAMEKTQCQMQELLDSEKQKVSDVQKEHSQTKALLETERQKVKTLLRAEGRRQALLETEHRKVEALEQARAKMEPIIRRLSTRARILDGAQDQIVRLTKELEKRDSILASVRQMVNVEGLGKLTREEIRKQFSEYAKNADSTIEAELPEMPSVETRQDEMLCNDNDEP